MIGYLHTGFEKNMEQKTWWKAITYAPRIDYVSFQNNELVFVLAIEKLLELEVPREGDVDADAASCELNRIHSHLVWLGTAALELGAISMFWYCFRERDQILDLFELVTGARMHTRYFQVGGLAEDIPPGFFAEAASSATWMPKAVDEYEALLDRNEIWLERTQGHRPALGRGRDRARPVRARCCARRASTGTCARPSRTSPTTEVDFDVPVYHERRRLRPLQVHMDEMRESTRIVAQCLDRLEAWRASRGSPTTARSCCRRARSSTPRWSR